MELLKCPGWGFGLWGCEACGTALRLSNCINEPVSGLGSLLYQGRSVHTRTYASAYGWNLENIYFSFPESIFIIKSRRLINLSHYILVSLPVWGVDISPFACKPLDSVTVVYLFPVNIAPYLLLHFPSYLFTENVLRKTQEIAFLNP